jgi:hypothetical protein
MHQHFVCPDLQWVRRTCSPTKHKMFFWLLILDRLKTRQTIEDRFLYAWLLLWYVQPIFSTWAICSSPILLLSCVENIFAFLVILQIITYRKLLSFITLTI